MRIVIDMQSAQNENRLKSVGRYTMAFAKAVVHDREEHEIILALSGLFPDTIEHIRAEFHGLLPQENILVWQAPGPVRECDPSNYLRRGTAELVREAFLAALQPDVIHISSLFEGYIDDAVTSIGSFEMNIPVSVSFHNESIAITATNQALWEVFLNRKQGFLERASAVFSSNDTALHAIQHWETLFSRNNGQILAVCKDQKPRLAFVSPLPPQRTGIADYSAELIPALAAYYDIELVVAQDQVDDPRINQFCMVRDVTWLRANYEKIDRVLYHIGNSPFHAHMLPLLEEIPGTVVLHDFYLGHLLSWVEAHQQPHEWCRAVYDSHGYNSLRNLYGDEEAAKFDFPANWRVLRQAQGVIVHSHHSLHLAQQWYGAETDGWSVIPLLRHPQVDADRTRARKFLGLGPHDFLVCTFGMLGPTKLNHRLLQAWLESSLSRETTCHLVFVGENPPSDYGEEVSAMTRKAKVKGRIQITGWTEKEEFRQYLAAADVGVQLRTQSRGETSAAVLDCMNHGLPTIVNANGSMADLDTEAVWKLSDEFTNEQLIEALEALWRDLELRQSLGNRAKTIILDRHSPGKCATHYAAAIERFHQCSTTALPLLLKAIAGQETFLPDDDASLLRLSEAISISLPMPRPVKCFYIDVSITSRNDLKSGIQRVVRALTCALLESPPRGYRVEPVYLSDSGGVWHYRYARSYTLGLIDCPEHLLVDEPIDPQCGDIILLLDLAGDMLVRAAESGLFRNYRDRGVYCIAAVYDLLPILMPEAFPPGADESHYKWLKKVSELDGAVCISKSVSKDLRAWQNQTGLNWDNRRPYTIDWFHLGADVSNSAPSYGLPNDAEYILERLKTRPTFLMVGTIEPRKAYLQVIDAFTKLWADSMDINLAIVGKEGWKGWVSDESRRNIPETVARLRCHPELSKRLFWLEEVSDEYLEQIYASSTCLIAASFDEGFGLPLIEAAQQALPIIARDIPVFREVAGEHAFYFSSKKPEKLALSIHKWLGLYENNEHPSSKHMPWLTWKISAQQLLDLIISDNDMFKETKKETT